MNNRQRKTMEALFAEPVRSDIPWRDIESLFGALGAEIEEGRGSRVVVVLNSVRGRYHRPHPQRVTDKGVVKGVRDFLENAGVV